MTTDFYGVRGIFMQRRATKEQNFGGSLWEL